MGFEIKQGDCLDVLKTLESESIDACVTDPPYELGFMGKAWDSTGIAYNVDLWREIYRVLKPGAYLLAFGGSRTYHRMACAIEDAGFEIRDQIQWIYSQGFPKSLNIGAGRGTALKPASEPICMARKPLEKGFTVAQNVEKWGTGAINIDRCRIPTSEPLEGGASGKRTALMNMGGANPRPNHSRAGEASADRRYTEKGSSNFAATPGARSDTQARFPANVIHDGSEEVLAGFPVTRSGLMKGGTMRAAQDEPGSVVYGVYGGPAVNQDTYADSGSAARFFYCAKADRNDRHHGLEMPESITSHGARPRDAENAEGKGNHHPTVKPTDLMQYLCRLVTPTDGLILDPFLGSGSTAKAAMIERFRIIGIEIDPEYVKIAEARCKQIQVKLF